MAKLSSCATLPSVEGSGASGDGILPSEPPLPRAMSAVERAVAVLLSLVADAPGAAPPEVEEGGREGGEGRWLWACCCWRGDGALVECPT